MQLTLGKLAIKAIGTQPCSSILDLKNSSFTRLASLQGNRRQQGKKKQIKQTQPSKEGNKI